MQPTSVIRPRRRSAVLLAVLIVWLGTLFLFQPTEVEAEQSPEDAANSVLQLVNEWRMAEDAPPLLLNPKLQKMAEAQANYLLPKWDTFDAAAGFKQYHLDAEGRDPFKRANDIFEWPNFSLPERIEVGENVAQFSVKKAVEFWKGSKIHHKTAVNPTYREAGIAGLKFPKGGYLFVLIFGARPGTLPDLLSPSGDKIFLSKEVSKYAKEAKLEPKVQFFDPNKQPLSDEMAWQSAMDVPKNAGNNFYVRYKYPTREVWTPIDRARDVAILPNSPMTVSSQLTKVIDFIQSLAAAPTTAPVVAAAPTNTPLAPRPTLAAPTKAFIAPATNTPHAAPPNINTGGNSGPVAPRQGPPPTNTPRAAVVQPIQTTQLPAATSIPPTIAPATQPPVQPTKAPSGKLIFTLFYTPKAIFLMNSSPKSVNLKGWQFGRLKVEHWLNVASFPAERFGSGICLEAKLVVTVGEAVPGACKTLWAIATVSTGRDFWAQGDFDVKFNDQVIQTCVISAGKCDIYLP